MGLRLCKGAGQEIDIAKGNDTGIDMDKDVHGVNYNIMYFRMLAALEDGVRYQDIMIICRS